MLSSALRALAHHPYVGRLGAGGTLGREGSYHTQPRIHFPKVQKGCSKPFTVSDSCVARSTERAGTGGWVWADLSFNREEVALRVPSSKGFYLQL